MDKFRRLYIKWLVWRGKAIDIWSKSDYPADVLSNLCSNGFRLDGMVCGSMEGFLQSLKQKDKDKQRQICSMKGKNAKKMTSAGWQTDQIVWWKGVAIDRQSEEYGKLVRRAYQAMFEQNERFRTALMSTRGQKLFHSRGESNPFKTILTENELCTILTKLRDNYDKRDKGVERKKRVFVDMDNVLVDFESGLTQISEAVKKEYEGRLDEIPGLFGLMKPMPGAIDAMHELQKHYDLFILSTAPWKNPSAWSDKVTWVTKYLDDVFHKRMVITHRKDLCQGDYLIDDRGKNGTSEFSGEWIEFGSEKFPDWNSVLAYLGIELDNTALPKPHSNVVSSEEEIFETGGGGYVSFYQEDIERMKSMTVDEQIEYKSELIKNGRYTE